MNVRTVYEQLPDRMQDSTRKWYLLIHPKKSWFELKKMKSIHESFVERFFDSEAEYERYKEEILESRITDICRQAEASLPDGYTIFDAHLDICLKSYCLIRKHKPATLVETGVYHGVSTLAKLLALDENDSGILYSIDYSASLAASGTEVTDEDRLEHFERGRPSCAEDGSVVLPPDKEVGWIIPDDVQDRWNPTQGKSQQKLPQVLADLDEVDLFFHNSEHSTSCMLFEFELAWEWLSDSGIIISNHIDHNEAFDTFIEEHPCAYGLLDFEPAFEDYPEPCSSGYIVKSS